MSEASNFIQRDEYQLKTDPGNTQLILIAVLVTMLSIGPTLLLQDIYAKGNWRILPLLVAAVALEGAWTTRWLRRGTVRINHSFYRLAEMMTLTLAIILIYWLSLDTLFRSNIFENFLAAPLSIIDFQVIILITLCLLAWIWSNELTGIFSKLALSRNEFDYFTTPSAERIQKGIAPIIPVYRDRLYHEFIRHWAVGGLLLALFAMIATFELTGSNLEAMQTLDFRLVTRLGLPSELLLALIVYFATGFWLASRARLAVMEARWVAGGLEIDSSIFARWRRQVILIIILVSLLAAFLPIGSTLAISEIIQVLLSYIFVAFPIILGLIPLLFAWLLSLFSGKSPAPEQPPVEIPPLMPPVESSEQVFQIPPAILEGFLFVLLLAIVLISLAYFLRHRSLNFDLGWMIQSWSRLISFFPNIWRRFSKGSKGLATSIITLLENAAIPGRDTITSWRPLSSPGQSSREKIFHYYLSVLVSAERQGIERAAGETPLEHQEHLINNWPELSREISDLTQLFLLARYSRIALTEQVTDEAKGFNKRLRVAIRKQPGAMASEKEQ